MTDERTLVEVPSAIVYKMVTESFSFTRPANTTNYTSGDVISDSVASPTSFKLENFARTPGGHICLKEVKLISSSAPATSLTAEIWFFSEDITRVGDNVAFAPTYAEMQKVQSVVSIGSTAYVGKASSNELYEEDASNHLIKAAEDSHDIYVVIRATNAYNPVSEEQFTLVVSGMQA